MPEPLSLTAIVLCKNGERTLTSCLGALHFAQAIIVGDDGSTDHSIQVAKHHHADVIKLPPGLGYGQKRNFLMRYVQTEWILFVDVDEIVSKELADEINSRRWETDTVNGLYIKRTDVFMGKRLMHGETAHTKLLRLAKAAIGNWQRSVHEVWMVPGMIGELEGELLHYSHPDLDEFFDKINKYTELEVNERPKGKKLQALVQLFIYPPAKFIQNYFIRFGFLDGYPGLIMAWMMSFHSLCVRIKLIEKL